jgi:hypothetical protein
MAVGVGNMDMDGMHVGSADLQVISDDEAEDQIIICKWNDISNSHANAT